MARTLLAFGGLSSAVVLACAGDWVLAVMVAAVVLAPAVWWVRGQLLATRDLMCGQPVPGRHRRRHRPLDGAMAALTKVARAPLP